MGLRDNIYNIISQFTGQANVLTIPRVFIEYTGSMKAALLLSQIIYWTERTGDKEGWFYKTYKDWEDELMMSEASIRRARKVLEKMGLIETKIKKANGNPTVYYKLRIDNFKETFLSFLNKRSCQDDRNEPVKSEETINKDYNKDYNKDIYNVDLDRSTGSGKSKNKKENKYIDDLKELKEKYRDIDIGSIDINKEGGKKEDIEVKSMLVLEYLNKETGRQYRKIHKYTRARLKEYGLIDLLDVIDYKIHEWKDNKEMSKYLRQSTLFAPSHFDEYLSEARKGFLEILYERYREKVREAIIKAKKKGWELPRFMDIEEFKEKLYEKWRVDRVKRVLA